MTPGNWIQLLAIGFAFLIFLMPLIYFAGKLVGKFETIITRLGSLETKVTNFQESCFTTEQAKSRMLETDKLRQAQWNAIDWLRKVTMKICFKIGVNPEEVEKGGIEK